MCVCVCVCVHAYEQPRKNTKEQEKKKKHKTWLYLFCHLSHHSHLVSYVRVIIEVKNKNKEGIVTGCGWLVSFGCSSLVSFPRMHMSEKKKERREKETPEVAARRPLRA